MSSAEPPVLFDLDAGVLTLTLNRPSQGNSFTPDMLLTMIDGLKQYAKDPAVRVLVITGRGKVFCSGMDLSSTNQKSMNADSDRKSSAFIDFCDLLKAYPLPVIARLNGPALGGGCVLLFLADVRIMLESAYVQFAEVKRGLLPAMISCYIVPSLGPFAASELFLTGRRADAKRCYEWGFLSAVAADEAALNATTKRYVGEFVSAAPGALATCKELIEFVRTHPHEENVKKAQKAFVGALKSGEMQEGLKAFREKRKPTWAQVAPSKAASKL